MAKLGHVITPWPNGLGSNFGWFSETSNHALSRWRHSFLLYFIPSWINLGSKKWRFCKKMHFFPRFWWRHNDVIRRSQIFLNQPMTQFRSISSKRVVAISPISFGLVYLSSPNRTLLLSVSIGLSMVVYREISIIGAWQVFANVGITFERINIFTCGKKQMVAWIKAVTGG